MKYQKEKNPTMKTHQVDKEKEGVEELQKQFMSLQQEWDSYKKSNPRTQRRYSTNSSMVKRLQLLDSSPRNLMSSLQQQRLSLSPPEGAWKVRTNDLAVEEIRRERRAAIESGKLKGRRLFEAENEETEEGFGGEGTAWCGWNGLVQESEVRSVSFCGSDGEERDSGNCMNKEIDVCFPGRSSSSSSSSSPSPSLSGKNVKREMVAEEVVKLEGVEQKRVTKNEGGNGGRIGWCMVMIMSGLAIALLVFAICIGFGGYGIESEVILVPT